MSISTTAQTSDVPEQTRRMKQTAQRDGPAAAPCCTSETQDVCCEPSEKASCCGVETTSAGGCGCR